MKITNAMTKEKVLSPKEFVAQLPALKSAARHWHHLSHQMIVSACVHAHLFGDIRGISTVIDMMPAGTKTNSMRNFVLMFAPVKWNATAKKFKFQADKVVSDLMSADGAHVDMLCEMLNKHWSSFGQVEKADTFKPFDLQAKLASLLKEANKRLDADTGPIKREKMTATDVNKLAETIRTLFPEGV